MRRVMLQKTSYQTLADIASKFLSEKGIRPPYPSTVTMLMKSKIWKWKKKEYTKVFYQQDRLETNSNRKKNIEQLIRPGVA